MQYLTITDLLDRKSELEKQIKEFDDRRKQAGDIGELVMFIRLHKAKLTEVLYLLKKVIDKNVDAAFAKTIEEREIEKLQEQLDFELRVVEDLIKNNAKKEVVEFAKEVANKTKQELKKREFKKIQSQMIYGRKDKVLKFDGEKLIELEG